MTEKQTADIPVVGSVGDGLSQLPEGFCERIEDELGAAKGEQIVTCCSQCGEMQIAREKEWTGLCRKCRGEPAEDERPDLDVLVVPESVIDEIRAKMPQNPKIVNDLPSRDVRTISIVQEKEGDPRNCYLYKAPSHTPHLFVVVDQDYSITRAWVRL
jgi:hypothetical protein